VACAPSGQILATGGKDATLMLWSTAPKPTEILISKVNHQPTFSRDNLLLATSSFGGPVTVWSAATRQPVWVLPSLTFSTGAEKQRFSRVKAE
jgi:WD40 repeat protein